MPDDEPIPDPAGFERFLREHFDPLCDGFVEQMNTLKAPEQWEDALLAEFFNFFSRRGAPRPRRLH